MLLEDLNSLLCWEQGEANIALGFFLPGSSLAPGLLLFISERMKLHCSESDLEFLSSLLLVAL